MFTDMELLFVGMESISYTILELEKITHDSSVHRTHIAHRVVLLGVGCAPFELFVREGPCRVFTDMELLFLGLESNCYTFLKLRMITHYSCIDRTQVSPRVVLLGVGYAPMQIILAQRSL